MQLRATHMQTLLTGAIQRMTVYIQTRQTSIAASHIAESKGSRLNFDLTVVLTPAIAHPSVAFGDECWMFFNCMFSPGVSICFAAYFGIVFPSGTDLVLVLCLNRLVLGWINIRHLHRRIKSIYLKTAQSKVLRVRVPARAPCVLTVLLLLFQFRVDIISTRR